MYLSKAKAFLILLSRHISTTPTTKKLQKLPLLSNIHTKYKPQAIQQAQKSLTDYFYSTRSLPFTYADHISKNSLFSLSHLIRKIDFSVPTFFKNFQKLLRYNPINEFEFFFESIGIDYKDVPSFLPPNKFFFYEDDTLLNAACALSDFGFPWNKLGFLCKEEGSIFGQSSKELMFRLNGFKDYGFSNLFVVGICLAFPYLLSGKCELGSDIDRFFDDLKTVYLEFDVGSLDERNVDAWYEICRKIRVFYDLGCEKGMVGEAMGRRKDVFIECPEEIMVQKAEYFSKFGVQKVDVGLLLLQSPDILNIDLENQVISVLGLLKHFGLDGIELNYACQKYPYVLGRNKMANLPHLMRAMDLHEWIFSKINNSYKLLATYTIRDTNEVMDKEFVDGLKKIQFSKTPTHTMNKLNFLHRIGFGENALTLKVLSRLHGTESELQLRFDCLLHMGVKFSNLCAIIRIAPKILGQKPEFIEQKVNFLCQEMKLSLQHLDTFPSFLCFDLENRIRPRYRMYVWLIKNGLYTKNYSIASLVATSEKSFIARLYGIHPAAPKQWLECFLLKRSVDVGLELEICPTAPT